MSGVSQEEFERHVNASEEILDSIRKEYYKATSDQLQLALIHATLAIAVRPAIVTNITP